MKQPELFKSLGKCVIEREVEDIYNSGLSFYFPNVSIEHPYVCDGLLNTKLENGKVLKLIIEYKFDEDFNTRVARAKVATQVLFYLKRFELNGILLPNVCMIADKNEAFVFHSNILLKYLEENVDWSIAPSGAAGKYPDLVLKISQDEEFNPFVFEIHEGFDMKLIVDKIKNLAEDVQTYIHVTEHNIAVIFDYFCNRVVKQKKIKSHDMVGIFMGVITNPDDYYKHPTKKNTLVTPLGNIDIDGNTFDSFFSYFQRKYTPQEKNNLSAIADRLIEDTDRRNSGDFWTPTLFVDYAHKMISEQLGEDWKDEYVVWDNCCGGKNLTRDYKFKELYCSTLFESELEIGKKYNPEATSFVFDFLNDYIPNGSELFDENNCKLPKGLLEAFKQNKKIVFFLNPPYATGCNNGTTTGGKAGTNNTNTRIEMQKDKQGAGAENIQHQFLYKICKIKENYNLTNVYICLFSKPIFLSGTKEQKFLEYFCNSFKFNNGILFQASNFSDVSSLWGITFNIWSSGKTKDIHNFTHKIVHNNDNEIITTGEKIIYNVWNNKIASVWAKENIRIYKNEDCPGFKGAIYQKEIQKGAMVKNALGYFHNNANSVQYNQMYVDIWSGFFCSGHGISILPENYYKCISLFSARKLFETNWIIDKDEYLAPNENHIQFNEFVNDSAIFSLFHTSSNQSSLRQIEYKNKLWDIKNEFFWMSKTDMESLANEYSNDATYNDVHTADERFVYNYIQEHAGQFSPEAQAVLDKAIELVKKSFKYREIFNEDHKEYQINNWDSGWYQIKALLKEYMPDELKDFQTLYKALADKMRPMVYELGFLKK